MLSGLLTTFLSTIIFNVPIAVCLGLASAAALILSGSIPLALLPQRMFTAVDSVTLLAVPLFIYAGKIMSEGGISKRLINLSYAAVGWIPGSLGMVSVLGCMFFAALSGSGPATVAAIGGIMLPAMIDEGYPIGFATALICSAGCIGVIIPPSIPFVNYATIVNISIGDIFLAGMIPGVLMGVALMVLCYFMAKKRHFGEKTIPFNLKKLIIAIKDSIGALLMPVIILGGIYGGIFTPTEAAAVACVYGIIVGYFFYRGFKLKDLIDFAYDSTLTTGMVFFIIATASIFSWVLSTEQVPNMIANAVLGLTSNKYLILFMINILLLINGCFMEMTASTYIYTPILFPIITALGINPIHFGVVMVMNMTIGFITPPLGIHLFVGSGLDKRVKFNELVKEIWPQFITLCIILLLVTYVPDVSLFLVNIFGQK
jgi:C4-dicarboxylate transporter DctM subunit